MGKGEHQQSFWSVPVAELFQRLRSKPQGLTSDEARELFSILHATENQFRTGWFLESVISASLVVLVIRTRSPFFKSKPGKYLFITTLLTVAVALVFLFTPLGKLFGFNPPPVSFLILMSIIVAAYMISAELAKRIFYKKVHF